VAILEKLVSEHPDNRAAAIISAKYELAVFALKGELTWAKVEALSKWITENPKHSRVNDAKKTLANSRISLSLKRVGEMARKGDLPPLAVKRHKGGISIPLMADQLPDFLTETDMVIQVIDKEYPTDPTGKDMRMRLALELWSIGQKLQWPLESTFFRPMDYWAMIVVSPIIKANADPGAVKQGVDLFEGIIIEYASRNSAGWWQMRAALSRLLANELLSSDHPSWPDVMQHHAELLSAYSKFQFEENRKAGSAENNQKISDVQKELLETLKKRIDLDASYAAPARAFLQQHLVPWMERRHWAVVDEMYLSLAGFIPSAERRRTEIALAKIWVQRIFDEHNLLLQAGLSVPKRLDPLHEKAIRRLYELQEGLDQQSPDLKEIRDTWASVVAHYCKRLENYEAAQAVLSVKAEKTVAIADEFATFQAAQLKTIWLICGLSS